ncbi:DNA-binding NarL/FixJ family response regulator [Rhizobium tibeticum]|uniref:response regulator transcription factor n=1 Tax=Rhizobium tibeticum TaxID=501024 RepID=UPI002780F7A1|nr:response regulator transcription factor [Rhizobium tibeticum]MDP9811544.1 DNA-binding NarL/FixJ family response regulator [Rhizobium tibeticum]
MGTKRIRVSVVCTSGELSEKIRSGVCVDHGMCFVDAKRASESLHEFVARTLPAVVICEIATSADIGIGNALRRVASTEAEHPFNLIYAVSHSSVKLIQDVYVDGVSSMIFTSDDSKDISTAISRVAAGQHHISPSVFRCLPDLHIRSFYSLLNGATFTPSRLPEGSLSAREELVLKLIAYGFSTKEIAAEMRLSTKTVETYKSRGSDKLSLSTRASIVKYGALRGWFNIYQH